MMQINSKNILSVIFATINVLLVWYTVKLPMTSEALLWSQDLMMSPLSPPPYVFGIVWPTLYALTILALSHLIMKYPWWNSEVMYTKITYWINSALCIWWSYAYWTLRNISLSYFIMLGIFLYSFVMLWAFYKASKTSAMLMVPLVLWYGFATYLSWFVWMYN